MRSSAFDPHCATWVCRLALETQKSLTDATLPSLTTPFLPSRPRLSRLATRRRAPHSCIPVVFSTRVEALPHEKVSTPPVCSFRVPRGSTFSSFPRQ